jgi:hypothetical protein
MIRIYIMIVVVGLVGGAIYGAKYYYDSTQARIAQLQENNAKLTVANETNQATINRMAQDAVQLEAQNQQLSKDLQEASKYKDELIAKLQKHDLSRLSIQKPGLIENRINNGTKKVFDALESLSGSTNP